MALLNTHSKWHRANRIVLVITILTLAGCVLFEKKSSVRRSYAFSHRSHIAQDLICSNCHLGAEMNEEPGMPGLGACRICHADLDQEKPEDRKVDSLFENKKFKAVRQSGLSDTYVFPHLRHVEAGFECARCHEAVANNEDALELPPAHMDNCTECHTERNVTNECAACHPTILQTTKPESHDELWLRRHGPVCRRGTEPESDRCELCHKETDCAACHQTMLPQNHTQQWRRSGHGVTAGLDRETCATCHQPSSCVSCHAESKPRTHVGNFGAPKDNHCLTCHEPVQSEGCGACHQGTPSHALATPKPASHTPAMNCRQCHLPGNAPPGLPHADNGSNCNSCHH